MKKFFSFCLCLGFLTLVLFAGCNSKEVLQTVSENLNTYNITATLSQDLHSLSACEEFCFKNTTNSELTNLKFHLHPNAFSENASEHFAISQSQENQAFYGEKNFGGIEILTAEVNGHDANFEIEGQEKQILSILLETALKTEQSASVKLEFLLKIPEVNHRFGLGQDTLNLGNWYPILCVFENENWNTDAYLSSGDPFYSKVANYEVTISYPSSLVLASTGVLNDEILEKKQKTQNFKALAVRDFAMIFSSKFEVLSTNVEGVNVSYFYFEDKTPEKHLQTCVDALTTFNRMFGNYPYQTLSVAKANFLHGGMEYPNLVYISSSIDNEHEFNNVIVHEIAHQWWYGVVGNNQLECAWIDEGLAEFSTALFYEQNADYDYTYQQVVNNALSSYLLFCDVYKTVYGNLNSAINRPVSSFKTEMEYTYLTYVKSLLMFDSLRDAIGKSKTEKCLKVLYQTFAFAEITPKQFVQSFKKNSKRDVEAFLISWLDGTVVLEELA